MKIPNGRPRQNHVHSFLKQRREQSSVFRESIWDIEDGVPGMILLCRLSVSRETLFNTLHCGSSQVPTDLWGVPAKPEASARGPRGVRAAHPPCRER